mmetsp:Transcript_57020/g.179021  ORF Transcript_57020/g.179021 Transcript_57020/m.179021 type:complete len:439 (+) Transcript_57020:467-1783(+)
MSESCRTCDNSSGGNCDLDMKSMALCGPRVPALVLSSRSKNPRYLASWSGKMAQGELVSGPPPLPPPAAAPRTSANCASCASSAGRTGGSSSPCRRPATRCNAEANSPNVSMPSPSASASCQTCARSSRGKPDRCRVSRTSSCCRADGSRLGRRWKSVRYWRTRSGVMAHGELGSPIRRGADCNEGWRPTDDPDAGDVPTTGCPGDEEANSRPRIRRRARCKASEKSSKLNCPSASTSAKCQMRESSCEDRWDCSKTSKASSRPTSAGNSKLLSRQVSSRAAYTKSLYARRPSPSASAKCQISAISSSGRLSSGLPGCRSGPRGGSRPEKGARACAGGASPTKPPASSPTSPATAAPLPAAKAANSGGRLSGSGTPCNLRVAKCMAQMSSPGDRRPSKSTSDMPQISLNSAVGRFVCSRRSLASMAPMEPTPSTSMEA